jgi:hypothetical protein
MGAGKGREKYDESLKGWWYTYSTSARWQCSSSGGGDDDGKVLKTTYGWMDHVNDDFCTKYVHVLPITRCTCSVVVYDTPLIAASSYSL